AFEGVPATFPGLIEAEKFDEGGEGVDVDINALDNGGFNVGHVAVGEYLRYTVQVREDVDDIHFSFRVSSASDPGSFRIVTGGTGCDDYTTNLSGLFDVPVTGGKKRYKTYAVSGNGTGGLRKGKRKIWLCVESPAFNIDSFTMETGN
ncbi:unnamed protein product, partial [Laminaria digitata]